MKVEILSQWDLRRKAAKGFDPRTALISLEDWGSEPFTLPRQPEHTLRLLCNDITPALVNLSDPKDMFRLFSREQAGQVAEQLIRPTGLVDPEVEVLPVKGQIDDLIGKIRAVTASGGRVLVTTLTKKMAEDLTAFLQDNQIKVRYMHSDIDTLERIDIITSLRKGDFDVLVGINLLREGLDLPEVQLVAILDADKEGFLRSETALIQTIGRAARNARAKVIMYADVITGSMKRALDETDRRRAVQKQYNAEHGITPKTIIKPITNTIEISKKVEERQLEDPAKIRAEIERLTSSMKLAASSLDFELAIKYREEIAALKKKAESKRKK